MHGSARTPRTLSASGSAIFLRAAREDFDGHTVNVYDNLPPGHYEAHSTRLTRLAQVVYFRVTDGGGIALLADRATRTW